MLFNHILGKIESRLDKKDKEKSTDCNAKKTRNPLLFGQIFLPLQRFFRKPVDFRKPLRYKYKANHFNLSITFKSNEND